MFLLFSASKILAEKNQVVNGEFEVEEDGWVNYGGTITPWDHIEVFFFAQDINDSSE